MFDSQRDSSQRGKKIGIFIEFSSKWMAIKEVRRVLPLLLKGKESNVPLLDVPIRFMVQVAYLLLFISSISRRTQRKEVGGAI